MLSKVVAHISGFQSMLRSATSYHSIRGQVSVMDTLQFAYLLIKGIVLL